MDHMIHKTNCNTDIRPQNPDRVPAVCHLNTFILYISVFIVPQVQILNFLKSANNLFKLFLVSCLFHHREQYTTTLPLAGV